MTSRYVVAAYFRMHEKASFSHLAAHEKSLTRLQGAGARCHPHACSRLNVGSSNTVMFRDLKLHNMPAAHCIARYPDNVAARYRQVN